jgi:hypothetical protein
MTLSVVLWCAALPAGGQRDGGEEGGGDGGEGEREDHDFPPWGAALWNWWWTACGAPPSCTSASQYTGHVVKQSPSHALSVSTPPVGTSFFTGKARQNDMVTTAR